MKGRARLGPKRLALLLSGSSGLACAAMMGVVLVVYGTPYNPLWWGVMAAIETAALVLPLALLPLVDWVIAGYRQDFAMAPKAGRSGDRSGGRSGGRSGEGRAATG